VADPEKNEALDAGEDLVTRSQRLFEIFTALDKAGTPEDFLSPAERAQEPSQERPELFEWKPKDGN
jgi:hypothetical protein